MMASALHQEEAELQYKAKCLLNHQVRISTDMKKMTFCDITTARAGKVLCHAELLAQGSRLMCTHR